MDSKCTHKKDSLHVFWMLRVIYKKNRTEPAVFQNRTETEPNLKNPFRTSLTTTDMHLPLSARNGQVALAHLNILLLFAVYQWE